MTEGAREGQRQDRWGRGRENTGRERERPVEREGVLAGPTQPPPLGVWGPPGGLPGGPSPTCPLSLPPPSPPPTPRGGEGDRVLGTPQGSGVTAGIPQKGMGYSLLIPVPPGEGAPISRKALIQSVNKHGITHSGWAAQLMRWSLPLGADCQSRTEGNLEINGSRPPNPPSCSKSLAR